MFHSAPGLCISQAIDTCYLVCLIQPLDCHWLHTFWRGFGDASQVPTDILAALEPALEPRLLVSTQGAPTNLESRSHCRCITLIHRRCTALSKTSEHKETVMKICC